ncbi:MAG: ABC transporter ATP-binding protein [Bryobacteraceae bacterium]|jgi:ABC-type polysaccharide/polyol phosphate transport system ATPase subunit
MSGAGTIELERVSKVFYLHTGRELLRRRVAHWFTGRHKERFYALKDVSLRMEPGEGLALVGANGAGKSTLLSVVAGLAEPDGGRVSVGGRVGALLQLGSGFHPDLTGAENLRLNAALLGLSRRRTAELFDAIVDFSGIGEFIGEPLRTYSSGMTMRLAFSVAAHMDPDIFLVDEILAVGDHAFQAKCHQRILELKRAGRTLLCVSHAAAGILDLCERGVWLEHGQVVMDGPLGKVVKAYEGGPPLNAQ